MIDYTWLYSLEMLWSECCKGSSSGTIFDVVLWFELISVPLSRWQETFVLLLPVKLSSSFSFPLFVAGVHAFLLDAGLFDSSDFLVRVRLFCIFWVGAGASSISSNENEWSVIALQVIIICNIKLIDLNDYLSTTSPNIDLVK